MSTSDGTMMVWIGLCGVVAPRFGFTLMILWGLLTIITAPVPVR